MNGNRVLKGLIEIYQNDFICGYEGEDKEELRLIFLELIVAVTRYVNNYRYCSKTNCPCSPESEIKTIVKNYHDVIFGKMIPNGYGLSEVPTGLIKNYLEAV